MLGATCSCADYVGASEQARTDARVVQMSVQHTSWTPPPEALAAAVERSIRSSGAGGGVFDYATTDKGMAVWLWVDGTVQSAGGVFDPPEASVRLCVRLTVSREPTLETAECTGEALPIAGGTRVISL